MSFKIFVLTPAPPKWGIVAFYVKDSSFAINVQISFNYLCPFKNYLEVPELFEHKIYIINPVAYKKNY